MKSGSFDHQRMVPVKWLQCWVNIVFLGDEREGLRLSMAGVYNDSRFFISGPYSFNRTELGPLSARDLKQRTVYNVLR